MPLDPQSWLLPPHYRRFPPHVAEVYESEDTPLAEIWELWHWKWDLVQNGPFGSKPDPIKQADRLGKEVSDFLRIEEESKAVLDKLDEAPGASDTHEMPGS